MVKRILKFVIIFVLLISSSQAFSVIFIDVSEFNFPKLQQSGIRVCIFDTQEQKYVYIGYFQLPSSTASRRPDGPVPNISISPYDVLTIRYNGNIEIPDNFNPNPYGYIVRTRIDGGTITYGKNGVVNPYMNPPIVVKSVEFIQDELKKIEGKKVSTGSVPVYNGGLEPWHIGLRDLNITSIKNSKGRSEKEILGELATEYTMFGYGYIAFQSQNGSSNGLDGVFASTENPTPDKDTLFFTESKCQNTEVSANVIMRDYLSDEKISRRIEIIPVSSKARDIVQNFIATNGSRIFKFAHRVKPDGHCQCLVLPYQKQDTSEATATTSCLPSMVLSSSQYDSQNTSLSSDEHNISIEGRLPICLGSTCFDSLEEYMCAIFGQLSLEELNRIKPLFHCYTFILGDLVKTLQQAKGQTCNILQDNPSFPGWEFYEPPSSDGNCFFAAAYDQLQRNNHELIEWMEGDDPHNTLRANIQGLSFTPGEWADEEDIINLVRGLDVDVAVYYTNPENLDGTKNTWFGRYNYYYIVDNVLNRNTVDELSNTERFVVKLAYTGDHYMSVLKEGTRPLQSITSSTYVGHDISSSSSSSTPSKSMLPKPAVKKISLSPLPLVLSPQPGNVGMSSMRPSPNVSPISKPIKIKIEKHSPSSPGIPVLPNSATGGDPVVVSSDNTTVTLDSGSIEKLNNLQNQLGSIDFRKQRQDIAKKAFNMVIEAAGVVRDNIGVAKRDEIKKINMIVNQVCELLTNAINLSLNVRVGGNPAQISNAVVEAEKIAAEADKIAKAIQDRNK